MTAIDAIQGVTNACQALPMVVTGGQPALHHLQALKEAGASVILDIRDPREPRSFDEPAEVAKLGMTYINIPVGPTPLSDELMASILDVLRANAGQTIYFHCASGDRVGGALLPHLILDQDMEEEDAIAIATRVGLRAPKLLQWGLGYSQRHR
jgi:protein tyrosine phosphatase (PTP) superfamily phosphohydrolase (DUF442 family)